MTGTDQSLTIQHPETGRVSLQDPIQQINPFNSKSPVHIVFREFCVKQKHKTFPIVNQAKADYLILLAENDSWFFYKPKFTTLEK